MSTIKVTNLQVTGQTATRSVSAIAAGGAMWNGVSFAIRDSTNSSSVTDNGTSDFTLNYSSAMSSAEYMFSGLRGRLRGSGAQDGCIIINDATTPTATTTRVRTYHETFGAEDFHRNCFMIFGDLA